MNGVQRRWPVVILFAALLLLSSGCSLLGGRQAAQSTFGAGDAIRIALPGPIAYITELSDFARGVEMALDEVNAAGVLGRRLEAVVLDDAGSFIEGTALAQRLAADPRVAAIVGHWHSHVTLPAATIYDDAGKLMLSPVVSNVSLTRRGYERVFQNIPGDDEVGRQMAYFARDRGYRRIVLLYAVSPYGRGLADAFEDAADQGGLVIVDRRHGFTEEIEVVRTARLWRALEYDAIFVAYGMPEGGQLIAALRRAGVDVPILGGDGLDFGFIETLGPHAEGVVIASIVDPDDARPELQAFRAKFRERYAKEPDVWGIQGYDSIKLLAHAFTLAGTTDPAAVAEVLHAMEGWNGVLGRISFNERGEVQGIRVRQKVVRDGRFEYLK